MNSRRTKLDLLTLRRPTKVHKLIESVAKPKNAIPKRGLPLWSRLPLDAKLPVCPGPKKDVTFTREKIGRKLWQNPKQNEFILDDPNCYNVSYHYDALHDENLRRFFMNAVNRKNMYERGFVTKEGDAICSLKDYNNYRRYLNRIHQDAIGKVRHKLDEIENQRLLLNKAREDEERDLRVQSRMQHRRKKMLYSTQQRQNQLLDKQEAVKEKQKQEVERLAIIEKNKEDEMKQRMQKSYEFEMKIRQRNQQAQDIERKRKIKAMRSWRDSDLRRRKRRAREKMQNQLEKEQNELHHWNQKVNAQLANMTRQRYLLDRCEKDMAAKTEARRRNFMHQRLRLDERLLKVKAEHVRNYADNAWSIKGMVKALMKAWEERLKSKSPEEQKKEKHLIEKTIQMQIAEYKNRSEGKEVLAILQGAKKKLDKFFGMPEPVSIAIDSLLNKTITTYVRKTVESIIEQIPAKAEECHRQHVAAQIEHDRKGAMSSREPASTKQLRRTNIRPNVDIIGSPSPLSDIKTRSLLTTKAFQDSNTSITPYRLVSFGEVTAVSKAGEGILLEGVQIKSARDRPPTPVPSLTELVDAAFNDPEPGPDESEHLVEKENLDRQLTEFSRLLLRAVLKKADLERTTKKRDIFRQFSNQHFDQTTALLKITQAILTEDEPNLMDMEEVRCIAEISAKEIIMRRIHNIFKSNVPSITGGLNIPKSRKQSQTHKHVIMSTNG